MGTQDSSLQACPVSMILSQDPKEGGRLWMGGETGDNESAASAPKEWRSLLSPLPHPLRGTKLNPSDSPGTPLSTTARTGKEGRRNCFCILWALLLLGSLPFHLLYPTLAHPLHNWVPTECQELCLSLGVSKRVRQLLLSKSLLSGAMKTLEKAAIIFCVQIGCHPHHWSEGA